MGKPEKALNGMIGGAIDDIHTTYKAKVLRVNGAKADVQPLYGGESGELVVQDADIMNHCMYRFKPYEGPIFSICPEHGNEPVDYPDKVHPTFWEPLKAGDVVLVACLELDEAQSSRRHDLSNAVIIGIYEG